MQIFTLENIDNVNLADSKFLVVIVDDELKALSQTGARLSDSLLKYLSSLLVGVSSSSLVDEQVESLVEDLVQTVQLVQSSSTLEGDKWSYGGDDFVQRQQVLNDLD